MAERDSSADNSGKRPQASKSEAAAVLLVRMAPRLEVFWVERAPSLAYLGGFHAFPGGRVGREDSTVPMLEAPDPDEARRRAAAARELFEETGVLLARAAGAEPPRVPSVPERERARAELIAGTLSFDAFLGERGLAVDAARFAPAGRWVSPPFTPRGFDTQFYLARCPEGEVASVIPGELSRGEWIEPAQALDRWQKGDVLLATPVKRGLAALAEIGREAPAGEALERALARCARALGESPESQGGPVERIEVTPGVVLLPLPTPTIPPATHTNCLILGEGECLVIDPGSAEPEAQAALDDLLTRLRHEGRRPVAIAVTHRHGDHTGGVEALRRQLGIPLLAHPLLVAELVAERSLVDGEVLTLGSGPSGAWRIEVLFTPGHTRDHVAFFERERGVLAVGDLMSGLSTVVIDPPEGDLGDYLDSLRRLRDLPARSLFPGHGPPAGGARQRIEALIEHRLWREQRVVDELRATGGSATLEELLPRVYADTPPAQWGWARRSLLAHLQKLEREGRARGNGEGSAEPNAWELVSERKS